MFSGQFRGILKTEIIKDGTTSRRDRACALPASGSGTPDSFRNLSKTKRRRGEVQRLPQPAGTYQRALLRKAPCRVPGQSTCTSEKAGGPRNSQPYPELPSK